ncbi:MAG: phosphate ABC transporter ATP-binding protein [Boseongicola sp.]|nr:phosphate ABC transporter ATP-binding protein [Boseongicola sp.]
MSEAATMTDAAAFAGSVLPALLPLEVRGLTLRYDGGAVIDGIDMTLGHGGTTVIMGANGAGKSLFLRLLHGLIAPTSGTVLWNGVAPTHATRRQALVFQKPVLLRRSVADNVSFALKARGLDRGRLDGLLKQAGLAHKARQPARLLSGGEAQRLALARALATDPEVLLLDEPTASLDPEATRAIEVIVSEVCRRGTRVLFVTHDIGQARRLADDVVFLSGGRLAEHSPARTFFERPESAEAHAYLSGTLEV